MTSEAMAAMAIVGVFVSSVDGLAGERFQKLGGSRIHRQCALGRCVWSKRQPQELFDGPQEGRQMVDRKG
jgi:hypothetical protein